MNATEEVYSIAAANDRLSSVPGRTARNEDGQQTFSRSAAWHRLCGSTLGGSRECTLSNDAITAVLPDSRKQTEGEGGHKCLFCHARVRQEKRERRGATRVCRVRTRTSHAWARTGTQYRCVVLLPLSYSGNGCHAFCPYFFPFCSLFSGGIHSARATPN